MKKILFIGFVLFLSGCVPRAAYDSACQICGFDNYSRIGSGVVCNLNGKEALVWSNLTSEADASLHIGYDTSKEGIPFLYVWCGEYDTYRGIVLLEDHEPYLKNHAYYNTAFGLLPINTTIRIVMN